MKRPLAVTNQMINEGDLQFGPYQRKLRISRVKKIVQGFDPSIFGVILVSKRTNGDYFVLDGQHRIAALRLLGKKNPNTINQKVECRVHHGLTLAEEAKMFGGANDVLIVHPFDKFNASVYANDRESVEIKKIVTASQFEISRNKLCATSSLQKVYRSENGNGPSILRRALGIYLKTWGNKASPKGSVIEGLGLFIKRHGKKIDDGELADKMSAEFGSQNVLIGKGRGVMNADGGTLAMNIAEIILRVWNTRRRPGNRLPSMRIENYETAVAAKKH